MAVDETLWLATGLGNTLPDVLVEAYKAKAQARDGKYVPADAQPTRVFKFSDEEKEAVAITQIERNQILRDGA